MPVKRIKHVLNITTAMHTITTQPKWARVVKAWFLKKPDALKSALDDGAIVIERSA